MSRTSVALLLSTMVLAVAVAGYDVEVTTSEKLAGFEGVIAIVPVSGPSDVNCVWIQDELVETMRRYPSFSIRAPAEVQRAMMELGIEAVDDDSRPVLAEALGADAFLVPIVGGGDKTSTYGMGFTTGNTFWMAPYEVSKGQAELLLVSPESGKLLMKGRGFGESEWKNPKGVVAKIYRRILKKALGEPPS